MPSSLLPIVACAVLFAGSAAGAQESIPPIERDPRSLPVAEEGRWSDWDPRTPPPDEVRRELVLALRSYSSGRFVESLEWLYTTLERVPDFPAGLHELGVVYFRLGRYEDAVHVFERFLALAPGEVGMTRGLGHAYYSLARYEKARKHYGRVLAVRPDMVEALRGYALTHMRLGEPTQALALLARVLELEPLHVDARTWRAQILFDEGRLREALEEATRARDQSPHVPRPWYLLAQVYFDLGRDEEGDEAHARFLELDRIHKVLRDLENSLLLEPRQTDVLRRIVFIQRRMGDLPSVRASLRRLIAMEGQSFESYVFALDNLEAMRDGAGAAAAATELERTHADVPETWKRLQEYYARTGQRAKQTEAGERYLRMKEAQGDS